MSKSNLINVSPEEPPLPLLSDGDEYEPALDVSKPSSQSSINLLEKRKEGLNVVFGSRIWGHNIGQKAQSESIQKGEQGFGENDPPGHATPGNVIWVILFGWWIAMFFSLAGAILFLTYIGRQYSTMCFRLARYIFWPFGLFLVEQDNENQPLIDSAKPSKPSTFEFSVWIFVFSIFLALPLAGAICINWFVVIFIPMSKCLGVIFQTILTKNPSSIHVFRSSSKATRGRIIMCNFRAFNMFYFRFKTLGMNVVFFNLFPVVLLRILMIISEKIIDQSLLGLWISFLVDLLCIIPITFYIGNAVSSIAAQTSYMLGALLNVTFGSVVSLILYGFAMYSGGLNEVILYALAGTLLLDLLLLPGASAIAGGIMHYNQKFNPVAAGVGSILLFISIVGAFSPTLFYHAYGRFEQACDICSFKNVSEYPDNVTTAVICNGCRFSQNSASIHADPLYQQGIRYIMFISCGLLPISYFIGLLFTFKTHTHIFTQEEHEEEGDGSPAWSIPICVIVLAISVAMASFIADDLVSQLESVTKAFDIGQPFLGVTVLAVAPSMTELVNAIKFATHNQISLSLEIGSSAAVQTSLIQIPVLIVLGAVFQKINPEFTDFALIFPLLCVSSCIFAVITFNYILQDGKTNYFIGSALVTIYFLLVASFYFIPKIELAQTHTLIYI